MNGELTKYLDEIIEQRIDDIVVELELKHEHYITIREKILEVEKELLKSEEFQNDFLDYEDLTSQREIVVRNSMYKRGFEDAFEISKLIHHHLR